jgi:hypothetical protein
MAFQRKKPAAIGIKAPFPGFIEPPRGLMNWGHVVRNTAIAIGITFVTAVGVYLAIRFLQSVL